MFMILINIFFIPGRTLATDSSHRQQDAYPDEVLIHPFYVQMPLNRILLIQNKNKYYAVKFLKFWQGETREDCFGTYECYQTKDGSFNFSKSNVIYKIDDFADPKWRGFHPFAFQIGNKNLKCGSIELKVSGKGMVSFNNSTGKLHDNTGPQFSPTPWTIIEEVNFKDPRIKWYQWNSTREIQYIKIEKLWK